VKTLGIQLAAAVEGRIDAAVVERIAEHLGFSISNVYGRKGKVFLRQRINNFNNAARFQPWIVLTDLDNDFDCAPKLIASWLPGPAASGMRLRVAVREVEAWLLADRARFAPFIGVSQSIVTLNPEALTDPKREIVNLARRSRKREIRESIAPRPGSSNPIGPAYTSALEEYIRDRKSGWRPQIAATFSSSLNRCLKAIASFE